MSDYKNLLEVCEARSARAGAKLAYRYVRRAGEAESLSFSALRAGAIALAARLQQVGGRGDRALIICPQGMDYVRALWGCLYSGLVAVPAYAPGNTHHVERLETIIQSAEARVLLLSSRQLGPVRRLAEKYGLVSSLRWVVVDEPEGVGEGDAAGAWAPPTLEPDDLALLQYTSGSVKAPRGVMVSHRNMLANQEMIRRAFGYHRDTTSVLWLPLFHDMGLVSLIQGVYVGFSSHLMRPLDFLTRPLRWLETISELRGTATAAPDFGYRLCVEKITDEQLAGLDLSSLETAINGAEPISAGKLEAFARRFAACGFRRGAMYPCYGLAEATLLVSGRRAGGGPRVISELGGKEGERAFEVERVVCGRPAEGCEVRIVDDEGRPCAPGRAGEIWVRGEHVAAGYWSDPTASAETFAARTAAGEGPFLRTGDLGYLDEGELVVAGRLHDLIIVRGANYYPNDIEETAAGAHAQLVSSGCAAFLDAEGELCLVAELERGASDPVAIEAAMVSAVSETYGLRVGRVVLVEFRTLPRTSSGKVQRGVTRRALAADALEVVHRSVVAPEDAGEGAQARGASEPTQLRRLLAAADEDEGPEILGGFVLGLLAEQLGLPLYRLSRRKSVAALGLDSVALVELKDKIEAELAIELPAELLFAATTIDELCAALLRLARAEPRPSPASSPIGTSSGPFAATAAQVALWALQQRDRSATDYNEGVLARIEGSLDLAALERSLGIVVARHPALRTRFEERDGRLWQVVADSLVVELRPEPVASTEQALALARAVLDTRFELDRETWRCRLIHGPEAAYLAFAVHHIVFDMWSFGVLLAELSAIHGALARGEASPLPAISQGSTWLDRARAQAEHATSPAGQRDLEGWRAALADAPTDSRFPISHPSRLAQPGPRAARSHRFVVPAAALSELRSFARRERLTLFELLFGGFFLLLSKYTGQDDLVIGTPLLGRDRGDSLRELGYFANMAPVRVRGVGQIDVGGLLDRTRRALEACQRGQAIPFAELVARWGPGGGESWVQTSFTLLSAQLAGRRELAPFVLGEAGGRLPLGDAVLHSCPRERSQAPFELGCTVMEHGDELRGLIVVRDALYEPAMIEGLIASYQALLTAMVRSPGSDTRSLPALAEPERRRLRRHLRRGPPTGRGFVTDAGASAGMGMVGWFRRAAADHGERVALSSPGFTRSYAELERETDQVARALVERGLRPGGRVALAFADRCRQTIAALSVLKAAGVFVPLDLGHPPPRLDFYLRDSGARWVLADAVSAERMGPLAEAAGALVLSLAALAEAETSPSVALPEPGRGEAIAYCIYTSGSTGAPKGVAVPHRGLQNLVAWHVSTYEVDPSARASLIAGPAFDVAVWEVWPYLCTGAALVEPPEASKTVATDLAGWIRAQGLTHSFVPTALVELLLVEGGLEGEGGLDLGPLRYLFTAGDRLRVRPPAASSFALINAYGPTENSVITTAGPVTALGEGAPDIGEPIVNQDLYILDRHGHEVPLGVEGELHIGGPGLAREYHARPGRTAERFVPNPFAPEPGSRMYATGDLVRLAGDGRVHFVARNDDQVKVRGHRVELGEIEACLIGHPAVRQCKVTLQESPAVGKWIAAYLVSAPGGSEDDEALRGWLHERLPAYMVPSGFCWLDALPVDANGKIDRRRLPALAAPGTERRAPTPVDGPVERAIAELFAELLGVAAVGRDDDFFALGGHSLLAGVLVQRIRERLGVRLAMADLFTHPQVHELAARVRAGEAAPVPELGPGPRPDRIPLSPAQRRLWFLQRLEPGSTDYNISGVVRLRGRIDLAALESALARLVARHGALRTRFPTHEGEPYQEVLPTLTVPLVRASPEQPDDEAVHATLAAWEAEPFSLAEGPLLRARLLELAPSEGLLFISLHHIVADGRSLQIMLRELSSFYRDARAGREPSEGAPVTQYVDYTLACLGEAQRARRASALDYWRARLATLPPKLTIPSLAPAGAEGEASQPGDELRRALPAELVEQVRAHARAWKTTEFSIYLATLAVLLSKLGGEDRLLIGIAYEGRDLPELHDAVGFFVNVLPILAEPSAATGFAELLGQVRRRCAEALAHSDASFEDIVHQARPGREGAELDLVQVMFDFEQFTPERVELDGLDAVLLPRVDTSAKFDLTFRCRLGASESTIAFNYRRRRYGRAAIEGLLSAYVVLLRQVLADPELPLADLRLVDEATADRLRRRGAGPKRALPAGSVVERLGAVARTHPDHLALVSADGERLSYGELDAKAGQLARVLREAGLGPGEVGAICLAPGSPFVITALAMLRLGAAYAAIDPRHPVRRRAAILADCGAPVLVCDEPLASAEARTDCACLLWSTLRERLAASGSDDAGTESEVRRAPDDPVYLVYTSGTTGAPKGVVIPERGLANLCQWHAEAYGLEGRGQEIRAGQTAGVGFDAAVWEIWPYLLTGASVWFAPTGARTSAGELARWLTEARITHVFVATPLAHELLGDGWRGSDTLELVLTGGDRLTSWALPEARYRLVNHYGPSENTVVATAGAVASAGPRAPGIGRPIANVEALVLGHSRELLPPGIAGELHLGGCSLMLGYRGDPELTRSKRVADPFGRAGAWLYPTGDRVCWNEADELEFLGRVDDQLEIRGFRVEPGEIVHALSAHPDVQSAVVRPVEHPTTGLHLAAYLVARPGARIDIDSLRDELAGSLPSFMVPRFLLVLDGFPLTRNGKVDLERLPSPSWSGRTEAGEGAGTRPLATATERALGTIWSALLGVPVDDAAANFFALGGHSLLAARAVAAIERELGRECSLQTFLASSTLAELGEAIDAGASYRPIPRVEPDQRIPLSPVQRRLWLVQQFSPASVDYNVVGAIELRGRIERGALGQAVASLLTRHAVLRTRIEAIEGEPCQVIASEVDEALLDRVLSWIDLRSVPRSAQEARLDEQLATLARERFELERGPLVRVDAAVLDEARIALTVAVHHIVVDGWSMPVLLRDLVELLGSASVGRTPALAKLPLSYADYSVWATRELERREPALLAFWTEYLDDRPAAALLPRRGRPGVPATVEAGTGQTRSLALGEALSRRVASWAADEGVSLFTVLFTAHVAWLYQLTRASDLIVAAPFHQRGRPELEQLVGFFVNVLPIRARFSRSWSFRRLLEQVRDELARVHRHHELPFDRIAEHAAAGDEPLYQTLFDLRQRPVFEPGSTELAVEVRAEHLDAPLADLAVTIAENDEGLSWSCTFRPELFEPETIARWGRNFRALLSAALDDAEWPLHRLPFDAPQRPLISTPPGAGGRARRPETLLAELAREVATHPSRPALTTHEERWSYLELDLASNQIAHFLAARGVHAGEPVGVEARHEPDVILTILAVLKLGALYVPVDTSLPRERLEGMLADAGCERVLTVSGASVPGFAGELVAIERERWGDYPRHTPGVPVSPDYPVYLAYTSGTTGTPKSSVLSHRGISNYVATVRERFEVGPDDRFLSFAPLTFDASLEELFLPLCSGACLHIGPRESKDSVSALVELCRRAEITVLILPTAYWRLLAEHVGAVGGSALPSVRMISVGGEKAPAAAVSSWVAATAGRIALWNIYGPSECSIGCVVDRLDDTAALDAKGYIPLREPVAGAELHVLDESLDPVPPGVDGEVYIGGEGLGHGYHRRPALTAARFVPNPFGAPGSRLYRTGDLARVDEDGELEFLGRVDFQVKIDGVRVEPGEVEAWLERHPAVAKAVVLARQVGTTDNHLVAYVTETETGTETETETGTTAEALLAYLREALPAYMVPATLDILDEFPLTTNHKIDRAALSERASRPRECAPAATETEALLLAIWRELLPRARFGVHDDIFSLGAGSLLVIQLITRIEVRTGVRLTVREIFEHPTIRALAGLVEARRGGPDSAPIPRVASTAVPLSGAQRRLWYLQQLDARSSAYHVPNCLRLDGPLRRGALAAAIRRTIVESESLRTVFVVRGDAPVQVVLDAMPVPLEDHDLAGLDLDEGLGRAAKLARELLERPFELERGPLCRFHLIRIQPELHVLVAIFHHIVVDGWSVLRWNQRLAAAYNARLRDDEGGREDDDASEPGAARALQYRDFSEWQRRQLAAGERERQLGYWRRILGGVLPSLELPTDFVRPAQVSERGELRSFELDGELVAGLLALGRREQVSLFMILLSAYFCLLHRYSKQTDLLVGVPALGRGRPELEDVIGFFVNTLVLRCRVDGTTPFVELLAQVRELYLDASDHQDVALEDIAAEVNAPQIDGRRAIFQTMFSFHEGTRTGAEALHELEVGEFEFAHRTAKFDLYLATWTRGEGLAGAIEFRTELFTGETIERMIGHFRRLLEGIVEQPRAALARLPLLGEAEYDELVHEHNAALMPLPADTLAHELFERQVAAGPERVAVTCGGEALSYAQLNLRANLVARELVALGVRCEDRVVLLLERDVSYLIGLLACLKAGAAFVPLDPDYPLAKRRSIVGQSDARLVISTPAQRARIDELELELGVVDLARVLASVDAPDAPDDRVGPDDPRGRDLELTRPGNSLAYVIYTSGSTGEPKGVMIEQRGMLNHLLNKVNGLGLTASDVVAELAATTFDVSIWQYLAALLVGGRTAVIAGDAAWLPRELLSELEREQVTVFESVPSHMNVILDELESRPDSRPLPRLRTYISNAEALTPEQCRRWFRCLPHVKLINTYGATECSDDTSHLVIEGPPAAGLPYMPIHGTLPNLTTYVLDEWLQPTPLGVPGDIYIGGVGVGRGYIGDPVRTALAFRPDPFATEPGQRFYRTGDLGRLHPGGVLEFLGRADFQVKIRGRRVELGEIEATLGAHEDLREVLVTAARTEQGGLCLLAYVVPARHPAPTAQELRAFVRARLVKHMVPAAFVFMDEFPLNDNGKVDRKRLPTLSDRELFNRHAHEPPSSATERALVELWTELLAVEEVGVLDSFFELGGHSLLVAELMIRIRNRFGVDISFKQFFAQPRVRELGALIDAHEPRLGRDRLALRRYPAQPRYPLAPCQIPEWYAYQFDPSSPVYNICVSDLFLRGALDKPAFLRAWQRILDRHEVLHLRFGYREGAPFQTVDARVELSAAEVFVDRSELVSDEAVLAAANRLAGELGVAPFDFERGPLFRLRLVSYGGDRHQLIFVVHHIIWDETSLINLTVELSELYNAELDGREPELPELPVSYFDYVQWMHELLQSGALAASRQYWLELYRSPPPPLDLPTDYPRPDLFSYRGDAIETWLPRRCVRKLEAFLKRDEVTLFMLMLAVLDHYIHLLTGQDDFVIGCPIAGRARAEFKPLLGLFATPMPLRCNITPGMSFRELLAHVAERTVDGFEHYLYPSNQLIEQLSQQKDLSRPKLFSVMFGVQNDKTEVLGELAFRELELSFEEVVDTENKSSRFDLNFVVDQFGSDIKFSCIYNTDLFARETVALMLENISALLEAVVDQPDLPLLAYGDLSARDRPIAALERGPSVAVDAAATLHGGFEQQAARTPAQTAVIAGDERWSYETLDRRANQLARYIRSLGVEPGQAIAVALEPSIELIVALLAILKTGCCYVPLVPDYPQRRLDAIVRGSDARAVLTTTACEHRFLNVDAELIALDELGELLACYVADELEPVDPRTLAYILYTSGTTGQPRGILIEHHGVASMIAAMQDRYRLDADDRVLFQTAVTFDVSVQEIFWPLAVGATVVVAPGERVKGAREVAALIERHAVSFAQFVPVTLEALVAARRRGVVSELPSLRQVICGGAALSRALNEGFRAAFSARLANHYGPTEVTVDASCFDCARPFVGELTPIGRPIANTRIFVLNRAGERVPRGVIGEIHVASPGLARGYLDDELETAAAFVELELDGVRQRLFKTGDLGHFDRDGLLYFNGRRDRQVKVRGNRVELEEIVGTLMRHPDVAVAALRSVFDGGAGGRLIAYIEQEPACNRVTTAAGPRYAFSFAQRPELIEAATSWHRRRRPSFFAGETTLRQLWPRLSGELPELQLVVTDAADTIDVVSYAVPLSLGGREELAPASGRGLGWSEALRRAFAELDAERGDDRRPNALYVFVGAAAPTSAGVSGWSVVLERNRALARARGFATIIYAHRPLGMADADTQELDDWQRAATDPASPDPQLGAQLELGGEAVGVVLDSLRVEASGCEWSEWTGAEVTRSGPTRLPNTLQPVHVDLDGNRWSYTEPCLLWVEALEPAGERPPLDRARIRGFLSESLPDYMVPEAVHFLPVIPKTDSGKIDERRLPDIDLRVGIERKRAETALQEQLATLVQRILRITIEVGINDDFFVLGGQSLKAVELISEVNHEYGADVKLREFYEQPTVEHLERLLQRTMRG